MKYRRDGRSAWEVLGAGTYDEMFALSARKGAGDYWITEESK